MKWAAGQPERVNSSLRALCYCVQLLPWQPRRSDVDGLLKIGAFERIGLVENCQHAQPAGIDKAFDRCFLSWNVSFDEHAIEVGFAQNLDVGRFEKSVDASDRRGEFFGIIRTNHALARGKRQRLDDTGKFHAR